MKPFRLRDYPEGPPSGTAVRLGQLTGAYASFSGARMVVAGQSKGPQIAVRRSLSDRRLPLYLYEEQIEEALEPALDPMNPYDVRNLPAAFIDELAVLGDWPQEPAHERELYATFPTAVEAIELIVRISREARAEQQPKTDERADG